MKSTPHLITRDHDPRRADQCNLHTHVIANNNKSPIEKKTKKNTVVVYQTERRALSCNADCPH